MSPTNIASIPPHLTFRYSEVFRTSPMSALCPCFLSVETESGIAKSIAVDLQVAWKRIAAFVSQIAKRLLLSWSSVCSLDEKSTFGAAAENYDHDV